MAESGGGKVVKILSPVMQKNNEIAAANRQRFVVMRSYAINLISSPGSGKTTLLEAMAQILGRRMAVIEGDLQTRRDAERVEKAGCRAYQIETGGACHLDAQAVSGAMDALGLAGDPCPFVVIENVGNLVCPSSYDLGEHMKVGMLSLPEGDDKVLKYPSVFRRIGALVISKIDLQPHMDFDVDRVVRECASLNESFVTFRVSAKTGQGVQEFCRLLEERQAGMKG
jgi:hydrogenase nickel incorporation protein HypB